MGAAFPCTMGGVLIDFATGRYEFFSAALDEEVTRRLLQDSENPIFEVESVGILLSLLLWEAYLKEQPVLAFQDNEGVKSCMVTGTTSSNKVALMAEAIVRIEARSRALIWWERVASESNPADAPSRGVWPGRLGGLPKPRRRSVADSTEYQKICKQIETDGLEMNHEVLLHGRVGSRVSWGN